MKVTKPIEAKDIPFLSTGVRVLMCTLRSKEGGSNNRPDRHATKKVSMNSREFEKTLSEMLADKKEGERIYVTINERDIEKAIRKFKEIQLENDYQSDYNRHQFYNDIRNKWISCLMKPTSKASSYFLIDIDEGETVTLDEAEAILEREAVSVIMKYKTKNGYHLITQPFNYTKTKLKVWDNVKTDGMALLAY